MTEKIEKTDLIDTDLRKEFEEIDNKRFLQLPHLEQLRKNAETNKLFLKQAEVDKLKETVNSLSIQLLDEKKKSVERNIEMLALVKKSNQMDHEKFKEQSRKELTEISEFYELEENKWGYNSDTGEIILHE